jgi:ribosomal protein L32E
MGATRKQRVCCPRGFWRFLAYNVKELQVLMECDKSYCAEVALTTSPPRTANNDGKSGPVGHQSPVLMPAA